MSNACSFCSYPSLSPLLMILSSSLIGHTRRHSNTLPWFSCPIRVTSSFSSGIRTPNLTTALLEDPTTELTSAYQPTNRLRIKSYNNDSHLSSFTLSHIYPSPNQEAYRALAVTPKIQTRGARRVETCRLRKGCVPTNCFSDAVLKNKRENDPMNSQPCCEQVSAVLTSRQCWHLASRGGWSAAKAYS